MARTDETVVKVSFVVPLIATFGVQTVLTGANLILPVIAPKAQADIGVAAGYVGVWIAVVYATSMFSALLSKGLIDRHGSVGALQVALTFGASGLLTVAVATPLSVLCGAVLLGTAYGIVNPASSVILKKRSPARWRALIFSIKQSGVPFGGFIVGAVVPIGMALFGWRGVASACALGASLVAILIWPIWDGDTHQHTSRDRRTSLNLLGPIRLVIMSRELRRLGIAGSLFNGVQVCLFSYLVIFLTTKHAVPLVIAGSAYAALQIGGVVGRPFLGAISDGAISGRHTLAASAFLSAAGLFSLNYLARVLPSALLFIPCALLGVVAMGWNGVLQAETVSAVEDDHVAEAIGAISCFSRLGPVFMPPVFGAIVMATGSHAFAFSAAAIAITIAGLALI